MHTPVQHKCLAINGLCKDNNYSKMEMSTVIVNTCGFEESHNNVSFTHVDIMTQSAQVLY